MGMLSAMWAGVAGLNVHGQALSAVSDNIANVNTHGFKGSRINFGDVMTHSLTVGGTVVNQVGTGADVLSVQNLLTQGSFESTDIPTDLAINGAGFFEVHQTDSDTSYYTRAGQFLLDKEGYMVNSQGYRLQGYNVDSNGDILEIPTDLRLLKLQTDAVSTTQVDISMNLDAEDEDKLHPSKLIDPDDQSTWNYLNTVRTYDSLGVGHNMSMFYQQLTDYNGTTASDASTFWKVSVFENEDGTYTPNADQYATEAEYLAALNANTYYLQFDTSGHLVGVSTGDTGYGDTYVYDGEVTSSTSDVASAFGGEITFAGAGANDQEIMTTASVTFAGADTTATSIQVTVGSDAPYAITPGQTAAAAAAELCDLVNGASPAVDYYAVDEGGGVVTFYASGAGGPYDIEVTTDSTDQTMTVDENTTLTELAGLINNGAQATGVINIDTATLVAASGDGVTIDGVTFNYEAVAAGTDWNTLGDLAAAINAQQALGNIDVTATTSGDNIYLTYNDGTDTIGTDGNLQTLVANIVTPGGTINLSDATLTNGWDGTVSGANAHDVTASALENDDGTYSLQISRNQTGADSTYTIDADSYLSSNTIGTLAGVNFTSATQTVVARDAVSGSLDLDGDVTLSFDYPQAVQPQDIIFDYTPADSAATTQSAGAHETLYLSQDGSTRGTLQSLDVGQDGVITGTFSNGQLKTMGQVMLVNFANSEALARQGDNLWRETVNSGPAINNKPEEGGTGSIESGALEQSNVDLANEFVKMILYQRAFQANSKSISTTDEMLQELINLKR